ncbi:MBL fold metallo-hydrolase, partial [bacterium]|nr:MBL fold metallo-hydrolase [bacterium]
RFGCPVFTAECMADNVANPLAWRQTCNTPTVMPVDKAARHGESWAWREFKFTAYNFPGQTLYHGGLLVEGRGVRMFFAGDSFTMAGIDDYCTHNRNWLGKGVGFDRCLALMAELKPTHIFNEHVEPAFDFTDAEIAFMRRNLAERETVYGALLPWEHANTGMDELWVRAYPYEQKVRAGGTARFQVIVTNHAPKPQRVRARVQGAWVEAEAAAKSDVALEMALSVPADAAGRRVFPIDVVCGRWELPQFTETILAIER